MKYNSHAIQIPRISKKFNIFPMPKYLKKTNKISPIAQISPRLVLLKKIELVKRRAKNRFVKNMNKTNIDAGSKR